MNKKPEVGQKLFLFDYGYNGKSVQYVEVTKVGRAYFTIDYGYRGTQFSIDGWHEKTEYASRMKLYSCEQDYLDEKEKERLMAVFREAFDWRGRRSFSLSQLRQVCDILGLDKKIPAETGMRSDEISTRRRS